MKRFLSLFSGIEAASVAWLPLGWECAGVCEIDPFPCAVLASHYPRVPNLGDITKITEDQIKALGRIDLVAGGFPCQDLSVAGKRRGLKNDDGSTTRSGLFYDAMRIFEYTRARYLLVENVPGIFSSNKGADFASVVGEMAGIDQVERPKKGWGSEGVALGVRGLLEWCVLDAQWMGLAQRRKRMFALLDTGDWAGRPPILLESESLRRDSPPRRETREETTVSPSLRAQSNCSHRADSEAYVTHSLRAEGFDASEDGTGRGIPLVMAHGQCGAEIVRDGEPSLTCNHEAPICFNARQDPDVSGGITSAIGTKDTGHAVAFPIDANALRGDTCAMTPSPDAEGRIRLRNTGLGIGNDGDPSPTLQTAGPSAVAFAQNTRDEVREMPVAGALNAATGTHQTSYVRNEMQVRRLTPRECERLMGQHDDATLIPYGKGGRLAKDGPRYKALGNSMAVPVMRWIGQAILFAESMDCEEFR